MFCRNYQSRRVWQPRSVDKGKTPHKWLQLGTWSVFLLMLLFAFLRFNSSRLRQLINSNPVPINPEGNNQIYLADQRVDHQLMSSKWCLVTKERKERKDTEHFHHPNQCNVRCTNQRKKGSQQMRKAPITTPRVTNALCSWERIPLKNFTLKSSHLSPRGVHPSPLFYHCGHKMALRINGISLSPSRMLTPEVTKRELLARILASTMIVPRLIRSRTPRAQLCDSLRLLLPESSRVWVCRSWQEFTSSLRNSSVSCIVGSFRCKLGQAWGGNMSL